MDDSHDVDADERLAEIAAGWVARLQSSDATEKDWAAFQRWRSEHASHAAAYAELSALWSDLKDVSLASSTKVRKTKVSRPAAASIVAICLIGVLSLTLYRMGLIDRWRSDYYTGVGEVRAITLEDGTRIDLNTDTVIAVQYSQAERRVVLLRGEAFFDVAKNPQRPFVVESELLSATAIGTHYAVRARSSSQPQQVQVEEGRVAVQGPRDAAVLASGDAAILDAEGALNVGRADVANETAWRDGKLVFSGIPLHDVLETLSKYRYGRIVIVDDAAANEKVSGVFDLKDTDGALRVLETSLPVTITRITGILTIVGSQ
jgi:transmembrane sensor